MNTEGEMTDLDKFEKDVEEMLGDAIRKDDTEAQALWSALANVSWYHPKDHLEVSYTFRAAGGFIAELRGDGDYLDWYCNSPYASVSDKIARSMKKKGWIFDDMSPICDEPGCLEDAGCGWSDKTGYRSTCGKHMGVHIWGRENG